MRNKSKRKEKKNKNKTLNHNKFGKAQILCRIWYLHDCIFGLCGCGKKIRYTGLIIRLSVKISYQCQQEKNIQLNSACI